MPAGSVRAAWLAELARVDLSVIAAQPAWAADEYSAASRLSRQTAAGAHPAGPPAVSGADWVRRLPDLALSSLDRWDLEPDGPARAGHTAVVVPVRRQEQRLALKLSWPHPMLLGEVLALRHWAGRGAARLVAADPGAGLILLERLDADHDLSGEPLHQACEALGEVLALLHRPAPAGIVRATLWLAEQLSPTQPGVPRRLLDRARGLLDELAGDADPPLLLHGDLHFGNVLGALPLAEERTTGDEWVAIDPQPLAGAAGLELQAALRNRLDEYPDGSGFRWGVRYRVGLICDSAGIDEELARRWAIVRACVDAVWAAADGDSAAVSLHIALMKALDD